VNAFPDDPLQGDPSAAGAPARESVEQPSRSQEGLVPRPPELASVAQVDPSVPSVSYTPVPVDLPPDPAWNALDVVRLIVLTIASLFLGVFAVLFFTHFVLYRHSSLSDLSRLPLVMVAGQALAYLLVLGYMYILVTRERHRPDFAAAIHWNWPSLPALYVLVGFLLSVALQLLASRLPIPKNLPIDTLFKTPAEAWVLTIFGVTLAPLMEELFFRGFLYPVLERGIGLSAAVFLTAIGFTLLHCAQLSFSWGPVLVIFLVGMVLTMVRARTNSVATGLLIHMSYNGTISALMFFATDGFRHLEKLNQ